MKRGPYHLEKLQLRTDRNAHLDGLVFDHLPGYLRLALMIMGTTEHGNKVILSDDAHRLLKKVVTQQ